MQYLYPVLKSDFLFFKNDFIFLTFIPKYTILMSLFELTKKQQDNLQKNSYEYTIV